MKRKPPPSNLVKARPKNNADIILPFSPLPPTIVTDKIIAIGASTGGVKTLESILHDLPRSTPGIVIVQHMPEGFTQAFANRLNSICNVEVKEAESEDQVVQGRVLIAPGNRHMILKRHGTQYSVEIIDGDIVNRHRPSVDVLFRSVANEAGRNALGIILTGMGDDGAIGMSEMNQAQATTIAQNEETCIVFGMPKEAILKGGAQKVFSLKEIEEAILQF